MCKKKYQTPVVHKLAVSITKSGVGATKEQTKGNGSCSNDVSRAPCS